MRRHQHPDSPFVSRTAGTLAPTVELRRLNGLVVPYAYGGPMPGIERQPSRHLVDLAGEWRAERATVDHQLSLTDRRVALPVIEEEGRGRHRVDHDDSGRQATAAGAAPPRPRRPGAAARAGGRWRSRPGAPRPRAGRRRQRAGSRL